MPLLNPMLAMALSVISYEDERYPTNPALGDESRYFADIAPQGPDQGREAEIRILEADLVVLLFASAEMKIGGFRSCVPLSGANSC